MNTIVQTPTPGLQKSLDYYTKLGFRQIEIADRVIVSDGQVLLEINPNRFARPGIKLESQDWSPVVRELETSTNVIEITNGYLLGTPSGVWVYLIEKAPSDQGIKDKIPPSILGNFAGISIESIDIQWSFELWQKLGFQTITGNIDQGWVTLSNESGMGISIMKPLSCPHLFFNPSLTYFNGKQNLAIIEQIRAAQIPIAEEVTHFNKEGVVDNVVLRDPGGLGCFVFND